MGKNDSEWVDDGINSNEDADFDGQNDAHIIPISGLYENWFLDYASYVILERAVPYVEDGLKPVQRRILHSMDDLDDGRYNKVANIIGHTMKYHPHGDASIGDALVQLGQKDLLIDCQGNWGNIFTGDSAAAPRYIEARLSKFAKDVVFNPKTTRWQLSYDGRNKEPITLPIKFPLLLAQGVEGIAVGLACKILPHNFIELINACIAHLKGETFELLPDFITGGLMDASKCNDGLRGGKIRVRAKISQHDKASLIITDIPFGSNTTKLIDSILNANEKGKIKIRKIEDNTAEKVEIMVHLPAGISPDITIDALYACTDCELSISPNSTIIDNEKPLFIGASEILKISVRDTLALLKLELEIELNELNEDWHFSSLEKIFIEERIYRDIEECETWEAVIASIHKGLEPFKERFYREITDDDVLSLTEIKIKRISKFDAFKADEIIKNIEEKIKGVKKKLKSLTEHAIEYYENLKKKYSKSRERKTEIRLFDTIEISKVVINNEKLYVNREEGFAGFGLKKDEFISECSDIDDMIVIRSDGKMLVSKVSEKSFVGKDILHIAVFKKNDERTIYNCIYQDGNKGHYMVKRFAIAGVIRDKEYDITRGTKGSKIIYLSANPNGECETIKIILKAKANLKKTYFEFDFAGLTIKGRAAGGNILSRNPVAKIELKQKGISTLKALQIWYDDSVKRLNKEGRGLLLGSFEGKDRIVVFAKNGSYKLINFDLSNHFDDDLLHLEKLNPKRIISAIYSDPESDQFMVKRFTVEPNEKKTIFISEHERAELKMFSVDTFPMLRVNFEKLGKIERPSMEVNIAEFIGVKGVKAKGKRLSNQEVANMEWIESLPEPEVLEEETSELPESDSNESEKSEIDSAINSKSTIEDKTVDINLDDNNQLTLPF